MPQLQISASIVYMQIFAQHENKITERWGQFLISLRWSTEVNKRVLNNNKKTAGRLSIYT